MDTFNGGPPRLEALTAYGTFVRINRAQLVTRRSAIREKVPEGVQGVLASEAG